MTMECTAPEAPADERLATAAVAEREGESALSCGSGSGCQKRFGTVEQRLVKMKTGAKPAGTPRLRPLPRA